MGNHFENPDTQYSAGVFAVEQQASPPLGTLGDSATLAYNNIVANEDPIAAASAIRACEATSPATTSTGNIQQCSDNKVQKGRDDVASYCPTGFSTAAGQTGAQLATHMGVGHSRPDLIASSTAQGFYTLSSTSGLVAGQVVIDVSAITQLTGITTPSASMVYETFIMPVSLTSLLTMTSNSAYIGGMTLQAMANLGSALINCVIGTPTQPSITPYYTYITGNVLPNIASTVGIAAAGGFKCTYTTVTDIGTIKFNASAGTLATFDMRYNNLTTNGVNHCLVQYWTWYSSTSANSGTINVSGANNGFPTGSKADTTSGESGVYAFYKLKGN